MKTSIPFLFFAALTLTASAQTEEPMHSLITMPAGASLTLDGTLSLPVTLSKPVPVVLLIAGSGPTDRDCNSAYGLKTNAFKLLADSLTTRGIAVARYDKRGSGTNVMATMKALKPEEHRFDFYVSDAVGFIRQLQADKRFSRVIVAGHSEGSLVGMLAAELTKANGFISLEGAGRNIADILRQQLTGLPDSLRTIAYHDLDSLRMGQFVQRPPKELLQLLHPRQQPGMISWMKYDPAIVLKQVPGPVLIIQGKHDLQVVTTDADRLKTARSDARLVVFDSMNHILKDAPAEQAANLATYNQPDLPLTPGLAAVIADLPESHVSPTNWPSSVAGRLLTARSSAARRDFASGAVTPAGSCR